MSAGCYWRGASSKNPLRSRRLPPRPLWSSPLTAAPTDFMSGLLVITLILASAVLHALWNALVKRERDSQAATLGVLTVATVLSALVALARGEGFASRGALLAGVAAGLCEAGYFATLGR